MLLITGSYHDTHDLALSMTGSFHDPHDWVPRIGGSFYDHHDWVLRMAGRFQSEMAKNLMLTGCLIVFLLKAKYIKQMDNNFVQ